MNRPRLSGGAMLRRMRIGAMTALILVTAAINLSAQMQESSPADPATPYILSGRTINKYSLMLFPFNSAELSAVSRRILNEHVLEDIVEKAKVEVIGYNDVIGLEDYNKKLSRKRADGVANHIRKNVKAKYDTLVVKAVGEDDPLYTNMLPEGRFYNRTVQIIIVQPPRRGRD